MINLLFIFIWFVIIALIDLFITRMGRRCCDDGRVPDEIRKQAFGACTWDMFKVGYPILFLFTLLDSGIWSAVFTIISTAFLHYAGFEDFMFYFLEPLFPQPYRDSTWRYDMKIGIWRCKSELTYLSDYSVKPYWLWLFAGKKVKFSGFIICNLVSVLIIGFLSLIFK
jgi:hypothetical protein